MIGDQQRLAKNGLARAVRNGRGEVCFRIDNKFAHLLSVMLKGFQAHFPGNGVGRGWMNRPIAGRPIGRDVHGIAAEFEDIPLRDADVLEEFPGGVRRACWLVSRPRHGKSGDSGLEIRVSVAAFKQLQKVFS